MANCPICGTDTLEYSGGDGVEYESHFCNKCGNLFKVDIEIVRHWDTMEVCDDD